MANIAQLVNVLQAMLLTDGASMVKTPTYHVFHMYKPFQEAKHLPVRLKSPKLKSGKNTFPAVSVSAAQTQTGEVVIAAANMSLNDTHRVILKLPEGSYSINDGKLLTAVEMDAHNVPGEPERVVPVTYKQATIDQKKLILDLPTKSVVVVTLKQGAH